MTIWYHMTMISSVLTYDIIWQNLWYHVYDIILWQYDITWLWYHLSWHMISYDKAYHIMISCIWYHRHMISSRLHSIWYHMLWLMRLGWSWYHTYDIMLHAIWYHSHRISYIWYHGYGTMISWVTTYDIIVRHMISYVNIWYQGVPRFQMESPALRQPERPCKWPRHHMGRRPCGMGRTAWLPLVGRLGE